MAVDSPKNANAAVEDRGMPPPWPSSMYEVSPAAAQNYQSRNYGDWGAAPFSESKRRPARGKHHHNSRRNHQQTWAPQQWAPQPPPPPPPAEANFAPLQQESQGPVAVNLQGLPSSLCNQMFLEAMLDQAGLADHITGCVLGEEQDTGKAVIYFANYNAGIKCVQHFGGRRWDTAGSPVIASIAEAPGTQKPLPPPSKDAGGRTHQVQSPEQFHAAPIPLNYAAPHGMWPTQPPTMLPLDIIAVQPFYANVAGGESPIGARSNGSNSPKVYWADVADNDEKENDLSEGLEGSTSAGSTGRNSTDITGEGFFFGCDVDTDDGF